MEISKYYTNEENKVTHVEVSYSLTKNDLTVTVSALCIVDPALETYDESLIRKNISRLYHTKSVDLYKAAETKLSIASLTETIV